MGIFTCWEESYLRLGEVDKAALLLGEILRGPLFVFVDTLVLIHLNLIGAAEIIASTRRDVWHGSLENTTQRHHSPLHWITGGTRRRGVRSCHPRKTRKIHCWSDTLRCLQPRRTRTNCQWVSRSTCLLMTGSRRRPLLNTNWRWAHRIKQARSAALCRARPISCRFDLPRRLAVMAAARLRTTPPENGCRRHLSC